MHNQKTATGNKPKHTRRRLAARITEFAAMLFAAVIAAACGNSPLTPSSGGAPYDVLLAGDSCQAVAEYLSTDMEGLPQPEPMFSVTATQSKDLNGTQKLWRSIVAVDINPTIYSRTAVKYEKNVYAKPQIIISITAPSVASMCKEANMKAVASLLMRHEMNAAIAQLQRKHNPKAEKMISKRFGCEMKIPADMTSSKTGKDFIWLSNNSAQGMQNICIYTSENRDSVMKANIKGETDDMYMSTTPHTTSTTQADEHGLKMTIRRGLWEMHGDAMGGPYVSHAVKDPKTGRTIVVETFVYAPEMKKRNRLRQTEAALYTLHLGEKQ